MKSKTGKLKLKKPQNCDQNKHYSLTKQTKLFQPKTLKLGKNEQLCPKNFGNELELAAKSFPTKTNQDREKDGQKGNLFPKLDLEKLGQTVKVAN